MLEQKVDEEVERKRAEASRAEQAAKAASEARRSHEAALRDFIRTQAKPVLLYLPREHTTATRAALERSREEWRSIRERT